MKSKPTAVMILTAYLLLTIGGGSMANAGRGIGGDEAFAADSPWKRLIVVFRAPTLPPNVDDLVQRSGGKVVAAIPEAGILLAEPTLAENSAMAKRLSKNPLVMGVAPDIQVQLIGPKTVANGGEGIDPEAHLPHPFPLPPMPADALYPLQWSVQRIGGTWDGAWNVSKGLGATIAVLDSGVSIYHPDIFPNLVGASSVVTWDSVCDDGGPEDQFGHGTWVASVAAGAAGNGSGLIIGTAPEASILSIKVLQRIPGAGADLREQCINGTANGSFFDVLMGVMLATSQGANVINMSLGAPVDKSSLPDRWLYTAALRVTNFAYNNGAVIVAAAGNESTRLDATGPIVAVPAELPNVIGVMATTNPYVTGEDLLASYSDYGSSLHGLAAPGGDFPPDTGLVLGACSPGLADTVDELPALGGSFGCFDGAGLDTTHHWYVLGAGTSVATAHVAGTAALIKSINPVLRANQVRAILQQTAEDIGPDGYDAFFNYGLVDADAALNETLKTP